MSKVKLWRFTLKSNLYRLCIDVFDNDGMWCGGESEMGMRNYIDEDEFVEELLERFIGSYYSDYLTAITVEQLRYVVTE